MALSRDELIAYAVQNVGIGENSDILELDCKNIIFLLENCEITIPQNNLFFVHVNL